jgi:hypothetical protein
MDITIQTPYYTQVIKLEDVIKQAFPHYEGGELSNIDILQTENYVFIAAHRKIEGHFLQEYFQVALYIYLSNKVVFSDQNAIDNDKFKTALQTKEATKSYLLHLAKDI